MKKNLLRPLVSVLIALFACACFMGCCRFLPNFAKFISDHLIEPLSRAFAACSARLPFPLFEALLIALALGLAAHLAYALFRGLAQRSFRPLTRFGLGAIQIAAAILAVYIILWYPAYWVSNDQPVHLLAVPDVEALCVSLIEQLNEAELHFSDAGASFQNAAGIVSEYTGIAVPEGAVKAARYPEWMRALRIAGLYSPWTGEAIVNAENAPSALPFTAVHELMHLSGIADEGQANIHAWEACAQAGGEAADSARLWALHYGMSALHDADEAVWMRCVQRMNGRLVRVFGDMNGFSSLRVREEGLLTRLIAVAGLHQSTSNYNDILGWLVIDSPFGS